MMKSATYCFSKEFVHLVGETGIEPAPSGTQTTFFIGQWASIISGKNTNYIYNRGVSYVNNAPHHPHRM